MMSAGDLCTFPGGIMVSPDVHHKWMNCCCRINCALFCSAFLLSIPSEHGYEVQLSVLCVSDQQSYTLISHEHLFLSFACINALKTLSQEAHAEVEAVETTVAVNIDSFW